MTDSQHEHTNKRTVIVTGAGRGIGAAIAGHFAASGANVLMNDVDRASLEESGNRVREETGADISTITGDISSEATAAELVEAAVRRYGRLDVLVNNAAVEGESRLLVDVSAEEWRRVVDINLTGAFLCSRAAIPAMRKGRFGRIVNIASTAGLRLSFKGLQSYTAAKAGLIGFTRHLAFEVAPWGITANCVAPGPTETALLYKGVPEDQVEALKVRRHRLLPAGRFVRPDEVAFAVAFLASDQASMIMGECIAVDGGSLLGWAPRDEYMQ